jgi:hypothetical protein
MCVLVMCVCPHVCVCVCVSWVCHRKVLCHADAGKSICDGAVGAKYSKMGDDVQQWKLVVKEKMCLRSWAATHSTNVRNRGENYCRHEFEKPGCSALFLVQRDGQHQDQALLQSDVAPQACVFSPEEIGFAFGPRRLQSAQAGLSVTVKPSFSFLFCFQ